MNKLEERFPLGRLEAREVIRFNVMTGKIVAPHGIPWHDLFKEWTGRDDSSMNAFTEEFWGAVKWNPMDGHDTADPDASPKPVFDAIRRQYQMQMLREEARHSRLASARFDAARKKATVERVGGSFHIGSGIKDLAGLVALVMMSGFSGYRMPHVRVRDGASTKDIWLKSELLEHVMSVAEAGNSVENAYNAMHLEWKNDHDIWTNESSPMADRIAAWARNRSRQDQFAENLKSEVASAVTPDMPDDIEVLKRLYCERLEEAETAAEWFIKNAETQQGVSLLGSCEAQTKALMSISRQRQRGSINLRRETSKARLARIYQNTKARIDAVVVEGSPKWYVEDAEIISDSWSSEDQSVTIQARHPSSYAEGGAVSLEVVTDDDDIRYDIGVPSGDSDAARVKLTRSPSKVAEVKLIARNVCGPSVLAVSLTVPRPRRPPAGRF